MTDHHEVRTFVDFFVQEANPIWIEVAEARWKQATTGDKRYKEAVVMGRRKEHELYEDPDDWERLQEMYADRDKLDPELRRQVEVLHRYFLNNQSTPEENEAVARLEADLHDIFSNHRACVGQRQLSDNEIVEIMKTSTDETERREAWEGSKEVGRKLAPLVRELVYRRNEIAQRLGFSDHYAFMLHRQEIDETYLFDLFDQLAKLTEAPFVNIKDEIDERLRRKLHLPATAPLMPWHYAEPFFQKAPPVFDANLDRFFHKVDIADLSVRAYDGMGLEVRDILERSDLYEREGKDQHAFCTRIGRDQDTRILCNLRPNGSWMGTQMHELGHAVYNKYLSPNLPYLLRTPAHTNSTEAIAMLMGRLPSNPTWLVEVAGQDPATVRPLEAELARAQAAAQLIFVRWALVMLHFERTLYAEPERDDLNDVWWQLVERYQFIPRPAGRNAPDWAAKYHVGLAPVYYHNYVLGELTTSQLEQWIKREVGQLVDEPKAGELLVDQFFAHGARYHWDKLIEVATGEPLNPRYFVEQFVDGR